MIRGTSSGADDVIGNGKCVLSGHLREAIWMIASKNVYRSRFSLFFSLFFFFLVVFGVASRPTI